MNATQQGKPGEPYRCPNCGGNNWRADYYEATWQSIALDAGGDGEPVFVDYTGTTGSYDDGATADEAYRCADCGHEIPLGLVVIPPDAMEKLTEERDHRERRCERLRLLAQRYLDADKAAEAEYNNGFRAGLDCALAVLQRQPVEAAA